MTNTMTFSAECDLCHTVEEVTQDLDPHRSFDFDTVVDDHFNKLGWWKVKVGPIVGPPIRVAILCDSCSTITFRDVKFTPTNVTLDPTFAISR